MKICDHCGRVIAPDMVHAPANAKECVVVASNVAERAERCGNCGAIQIPGYKHELLLEGCCEIVRMTPAEIETQLQQQRSDRGEPSTAL